MDSPKPQSNLLAEHFNQPLYIGTGQSETEGHGWVPHMASGTVLHLWLRIEDERITGARFGITNTTGLSSISSFISVLTACALFVTERITDQDVCTAAALHVEDVVDALELPSDDVCYAQLVIVALLQAIQDHRSRLHGEVSARFPNDWSEAEQST